MRLNLPTLVLGGLLLAGLVWFRPWEMIGTPARVAGPTGFMETRGVHSYNVVSYNSTEETFDRMSNLDHLSSPRPAG